MFRKNVQTSETDDWKIEGSLKQSANPPTPKKSTAAPATKSGPNQQSPHKKSENPKVRGGKFSCLTKLIQNKTKYAMDPRKNFLMKTTK